MPARLPSFLAALALASACGPTEGTGPIQRPAALDVTLQSQHGGTSHEAGNNCMACHQAQGLGKGLFTVAGTAYTPTGEPQAHATIIVATSQENVLTLQTDASGNFYTTAPVPLPEESIFPSVSSTSGAAIAMPFPTQSGACNMCHVGRQRLVLE